MSPAPGQRVSSAAMSLEFPISLGVYDKYDQAQRAVDFLSDQEFPVENCLIVGTDLKQIERVTGRLTWARVATGGILSGIWMGLFVGLIVSMFGDGSTLAIMAATALFGAAFSLVLALVGYAATGGRRDFTSVSQVVATRYEVLVEHKVAARGRELLAHLPSA